MKRKWTNQELNVLREEYTHADKSMLCDRLDRSWSSISMQAFRLKLKRNYSVVYPDDSLKRFHGLYEEIDDCWIWQGHIVHNGYGQFSVNGKTVRAHRFAYEAFNGKIPDDHTVHHVCYHRACVNPKHLRVMTSRDNTLDHKSTNVCAINSRKKYCPRGHKYNTSNTYVDPRGSRQCRTCKKESERRNRK